MKEEEEPDDRVRINSNAKDVDFVVLPFPNAKGGVPTETAKDSRTLIIVFCLMVVVGLGNKVFQKLMTIPMQNYPNFLNLLTTFVYLPVCFAYIIPMARNGGIPKEQLALPKRPFAIMGALDAMAGILQMFSATYLPGPLLILLSQAAIPVSMIISKYLLKSQYTVYQYVGALIVAGGIVCVLAPTMNGSGSVLWACMMILSTIPMALSSVYKEIALGETELDPIYLNGWIAVFQLIFSLLLCVPASLASSPPVPIPDLPQSMLDGLYCYVGTNSQTCASGSSDCTPDDCFPAGPMFVNLYLVFNQAYNLLIILIIKFGSSNLLYMALTLMVPLGNVAFTLPFVPGNSPLRVTDIIGLVIIMSGLVCYRFASDLSQWLCPRAASLIDYKPLLGNLQQDVEDKEYTIVLHGESSAAGGGNTNGNTSSAGAASNVRERLTSTELARPKAHV